MTNKPPTLGLLAGLGVGAGIFYYRSIVKAHLERGLSAKLLTVHADVRKVMRHAELRESAELAAYLAGLLTQLARAGAQMATIPAFSPQICAQELNEMTPLPLISLLDVIVAELGRRRFQRIAIFGARVTMETKLFGKLPDMEVVSPAREELDFIGSTYARIVEEERASQEDYTALRGLAHSLIDREQLDGILLAGTDLSFVFNEENADSPHIDGARVHIDAIMNRLAAGA